MPKSKRVKVIRLTKVQGKGRERKAGLVDDIQECVSQFKTIYVLGFDHLRTDHLKSIRTDFKESRFVLGKNKVVRLALGRTKEEAFQPGLEKLAQKLVGEVGLLFTNKPVREVENYFKEFSRLDYARAGITAPRTCTIAAGPVAGLPSSMLEPMRDMKIPVVLNKGVIEIEHEYNVCEEGDILTPEQARALKLFDIKLSQFRVKMHYRWRQGQLTRLGDAPKEADMDGY